MSMTELTVVWLGSLATLTTVGLFYQFGDRWTALLIEFGGAMLWSLFAVSSMNVIVTDGVAPPVSEPMLPLVYLGIGMALVTFLFALYDLFKGVSAEASDMDVGQVGR